MLLGDIAERIHPQIQLPFIEDLPDNRILGYAISGKADGIVTGHEAILNLGDYQRIRITLPERLLGSNLNIARPRFA